MEEFRNCLNCLADLGLKLYRAGIDIEDLEKHLKKPVRKKLRHTRKVSDDNLR
jgi:hypothetical protein